MVCLGHGASLSREKAKEEKAKEEKAKEEKTKEEKAKEDTGMSLITTQILLATRALDRMHRIPLNQNQTLVRQSQRRCANVAQAPALTAEDIFFIAC